MSPISRNHYMMNWKLLAVGAAIAVMFADTKSAKAQRVLGVDISYWNRGSSSGSSDGISQAAWSTAFTTPDQNGNTRMFAQIRSSRGGTTGTNVSSGTPGNPSTPSTLSERYDDPDYFRNITRAANAGFIAGPYHFGRPELGNSGTDEANHFIEAAGAWMRPGYMMPMYDLESGSGIGSDPLAHTVLRSRPDVSDDLSRKITDTNARRAFAIPADFTPSAPATGSEASVAV